MKVGLDIDNSIIDYRLPLAVAAHDFLGLTIATGLTREEVKRRVLEHSGEGEWTRLQGEIYGDYSHLSSLFGGVSEFLEKLREAQHELFLISHKTRFPISGGKTDLQECSLLNLERLGLFDLGKNFLVPDRVFLCESEDKKIDRIADLGLDVFVDDLVKVLERIPSVVKGVHVHCRGDHVFDHSFRCAGNWGEVSWENHSDR